MTDSFFSHMENGVAANRVLIVEPTQSHLEVLPSLVYYCNTLGYGVDVLLLPQQFTNRMIEPFLKTVGGLDVNFFYSLTEATAGRLAEVINRTYQIIYCNTFFDFFVAKPFFDFCSRLRVEKVLATAHNYSHYAARKHLCPGVRDDHVFVLNPSVAQKTGTRYLSPSMFFFDAASRPERPRGADFLCIGAVTGQRRDYNQLIDACILLAEKGVLDSITVSVACAKFNTDYYTTFRENLVRYSLDRAITIREDLPFADLFRLAADTPFQLFLLNKRSQKNLEYLTSKIGGGLSIAYGFGLVPVIEDVFAENWGVAPLSLTYDGAAGLAAAMTAVAENPALGLARREKILKRNAALVAESLDALDSVLKN